MHKTIIITGAMGSGKTEIALQMAEDFLNEISSVTLIDLDFINPYYRSADKRSDLEKKGIKLLAPENTSIDTPLIDGGTMEAIAAPVGQTIVDLGGDPGGATVIAQFAKDLTGYEFYAVINFSRITTENIDETIMILKAIESASTLKITGLISNTHMKEYTTPEIILDGLSKCVDLGETLKLPVVSVVTPYNISKEVLGQTGDIPVMVISRKLQNIWEL